MSVLKGSRKYQYSFIICFIFCFLPLFGQKTEISGVVNTYRKVRSIGSDRVTLWNTSGYQEGDKVLLIQMKGAIPLDDGDIQNIRNTGHYEILIIEGVIEASNEIIFSADLSRSYDADEPVQLIRIAEYERAEVTGEVTCPAWNDSTGGVVAIITNKSLTLNNNINVSGKGFKGGNPDLDPDYQGDCSISSSLYEERFYHVDTLDRAGRKGDGIMTSSYSKIKGFGRLGNAGGGGNGKYSGGGGGSNYGYAGGGGDEIISCTDNDVGGFGGGFDPVIFLNNAQNRIFMGGGGGTGTQNIAEGYEATKGGNGGGIIILLADTLIGHGDTIMSDGETVTERATAGAGGGGAGGTIVIDVNHYADENVYLGASGGKGGYTSGSEFTGPGGGGGIGVIWHSKNALPGNVENKVINKIGGSGRNSFGLTYGATQQGILNEGKGVLPDLILPLTGFLFNTISSDQTICEGEAPEPLTGTLPKGGDGQYDYQWQLSDDLLNWQNTGTIDDSIEYSPGTLTDTTYYRRIVTSASLFDTSKIVSIYVHKKIVGNSIQENQTICYNQTPETLTGANYSGGDGSNYVFQWQFSSDSIVYNNIDEHGTSENYGPSSLESNRFYRRKIYSGACNSISDTIKITVLPEIDGNSIASDQDVCQGNLPDDLTGSTPTGGQEGSYNYLWQRSTNGVTWLTAEGNASEKNYSPSVPDDTTYYKRIVTSGPSEVCTSESNIVEIDLLNNISNNTISESDTICSGSPSPEINGSLPQGGNNVYDYEWLSSNDNIIWNVDGHSDQDYRPGDLTGDTYYKRIVYSGNANACIDSSNSVLISVLPAIQNNNISFGQQVCEGTVPQTLTGTSPSGGTGTFEFQWQYKTMEISDWTKATGQHELQNYNFESSPGPGEYYYRRTVTSNVCNSISDSVKVEVLPEITGNDVNAPDAVCSGNTPGVIGTGTLSGGNEEYNFTWEESENGSVFNEAVGISNELLYDVPVLTDSIFYRRIVTSGACKDTSAVETISINALPEARLQDMVDTVCQGNGIELNINLTGEPGWEIYVNDNGDPVLLQSQEQLAVFNLVPDNPTLYFIDSVIDGNGCRADLVTGSADVMVYENPEAEAGDDAEVCGDTYQLSANDDYPGEWEFDEDVVLSIENNNASTEVTVNRPLDNKTFIWVQKNWQCIDRDTVQIRFYEQPAIPDAGPDQPEYFEESIILEGSVPEYGTGAWTVNNESVSFSDTTDPNAEARGLKLGPNVFTWTVKNGVCPAVSDSVVIILNQVNAPQGFSPNGDGVNDYFKINGLDQMDEGFRELIILNRWGQEVYYQDNYDNEWIGVNQDGLDLVEGTYFYIFKAKKDSEDVVLTGFVVIKR